jgi:ribosomal protein S12 methylthiotransferase accessory factor
VQAAESTEAPADRAAQLAGVVRALDRAGYDPVFVNLTTADVDQLGLVVGRVVVPGLHPIASGLANMPLETRRLRKVARRWDWAFPDRLNAAPHPFP